MCDQAFSDIPLPSGWPDSVRSAVIYVISLAHYAITCANRPAANEMPRIEVRPPWPTEASCATPTAAIDGEPGRKVELVVSYHAGRKHLPIVQLKRVA